MIKKCSLAVIGKVSAPASRIQVEHNELSGRAKDMGAAAVMLTIFMTVGVWLCVLLN
ncbi:diacylglycerol kinase [Halomonas glaciei]|uniref:Diacylglycerol kinase n=1 Tax=Vreelandella glaciei TaxID=186761 RepID=A0A7Z0LSX4_9GAMM|nr:diacylglycerol kinase [Halomonas glaciei]